jgi:hypothetical protein
MSGSGGGSQQTTTTQQLPAWAQPYAQQILQQGSALSQQGIPQYGGSLVAGLSDMQNQALQQIQQTAGAGTPGVNTAIDTTQNLMQNPMGGYQYNQSNVTPQTNPYLGQNPYLQQQVQQAQGVTAQNYATGTAAQTMGQFRNAGAFGGSAQQQYQNQQNQQLGQQLGNIATNMYGQDYANTQNLAQQGINLNTQTQLANNAMNAQYGLAGQSLANQTALQAAGMAPGLAQGQYTGAQALLNAGQLPQQQAQNQLNAQYQQWYNAAMSPYQQLGVLQSALQGAMGAGAQGVTQATTPTGGGGMGGALGGAASGAAMGSMFGPWGTAIGGVGGGLMGMFS